MAVASGVSDGLSADELAFRWYGGRLSVCFTATLGERWHRSIERLRAPEDLARWLHDSGMTHTEPQVSVSQLHKARLLREALYRTFKALNLGAAIDNADVDLINNWATRPVAGPRLTLAGGRVCLAATTHDTPGLLTILASDAVDLICGPFAGRIRECASDDCALLFVDESHSGRRRWCSMDTCGARSKMSAYRKRHSSSNIDQPR